MTLTKNKLAEVLFEKANLTKCGANVMVGAFFKNKHCL
jgi:nucleoid DNA-binding protein